MLKPVDCGTMNLGEFITAEYLLGHGNYKINIDVVSKEVKRRYSSLYEKNVLLYGGMSGRLNQIPAYLSTEFIEECELDKETETYYITL